MTTLLRNARPPKEEMAVETWVNTQCPYCGVGCGLLVGTKQGMVVKVKGDPDHPSTLGDLCLKPIHLPAALYASDRALYPLVRHNRESKFERASWPTAIDHVAATFLRIRAQHGADAIAFYGSGQFTTEDYYVANKLMKGFIGSNNFDANSRLCMSSAVAAYATAFGSDGPPCSYDDIDLADCFFLIGANMADCHPVLFNRIKRRKQRDPDKVKIIVVDPRRTRTAEIADLYLAIEPGSDVALLNGMLHILLEQVAGGQVTGLQPSYPKDVGGCSDLAKSAIDHDFIGRHTNGFAALADAVAGDTPALVAAQCGIAEEDLRKAALLFGNAANALSFWSMGLNQSTIGVQKNSAVINLHLATGQIGRPGCGPFSLTGQPNAMGGREVGGLAHLLPGYRQVANRQHRAEVEQFWGLPANTIAAKPGLSTVEMFEAAARGEIKALWVMCTNPAVSMPDLDLVEAALRKLELLVVSDAYHPTDTSEFAHVVLPAAQWTERRGVMTNSERRITYLAHIVNPPGEALPDWQIINKVACALGFAPHFNFPTEQAVFDEFKQLTQGRPCDYSGVSYERLKNEGPLQWPVPTPDHPGSERLYQVDLYQADEQKESLFNTANGKANFVITRHQSIYEAPDAAYPLVLTTGRLKNQWHTMTRTGKSPSLLKDASEPLLEIHPNDAARRQIEAGDLVEVQSRRGKVQVKAVVTNKIRPGTCFLPFHWGRKAGLLQAANNITLSNYDPVSKEPELKACAIQVSRVATYKMVDLDKLFKRFTQMFDEQTVTQLKSALVDASAPEGGG